MPRPNRPGALPPRLERLADRTTPAVIPVSPAASPTPVDNDFTRIQTAVSQAVAGDTIELSGTFDFAEPNAAARWARGADGAAGTADDYAVSAPDQRGWVTLTAAGPGAATVRGPGDLPYVGRDAFLSLAGSDFDGWVVSNLTILDFDLAIGMHATAPGAFDGVWVTGNRIRLAVDHNGRARRADPFENVGIRLSWGTGQLVTDNRIEIPGTGTSSPLAADAAPHGFATSVGIQTEPGGPAAYDFLGIVRNTIQVLGAQSAFPERVVGIWEAGASVNTLYVSDNVFENADPGNRPAANRQTAVWLTSADFADRAVTVRDNSVSGAAQGFRLTAGPSEAPDPPVVEFINNTATGIATGLAVEGGVRARLSGNVWSGGPATGAGLVVGPGARADLGGDRLVGFGTGVRSHGATRVYRGYVRANGVGIEAAAGQLLVQESDLRFNGAVGLLVRGDAAVDAGQIPTATRTPEDFTGLGISQGLNNFSGGYPLGTQAIATQNVGPGPAPVGDVLAQANYWEVQDAPIESVVRHRRDDPELRFVDFALPWEHADLGVTAQFVTPRAFVGQHLTILITVTNHGPSDAADVRVTAFVPSGTAFVSVAADQGTAAAEADGVVTATVGRLDAGRSTRIRLVVEPSAVGAVYADVTVGPTGSDPDPANNSSTPGVGAFAAGGDVRASVVSGRLVLAGDGADNAVQVLSAAEGALLVRGVGGTQIQFGGMTGGSALVPGARAGVSGNLAGGNDTLIVDGSAHPDPLFLAGPVRANLGRGNDALHVLHVSAQGGVTAVGGPGDNVGTVAECVLGGNLRWAGGAGVDALTVADTSLIGTLAAAGGAGADRLDVTGLEVGRNFVWAGGADNDALTVAASRVYGTTTLSAGAGGDTATVNGARFQAFRWTGGKERNFLTAADTVFEQSFVTRGGAGADQILAVRTNFLGTVLMDGGPGADVLGIGAPAAPVGSNQGNSFLRLPVVWRFELGWG
jgi:uncharacterized repeat protein (TIGR01451 family)